MARLSVRTVISNKQQGRRKILDHNPRTRKKNSMHIATTPTVVGARLKRRLYLDTTETRAGPPLFRGRFVRNHKVVSMTFLRSQQRPEHVLSQRDRARHAANCAPALTAPRISTSATPWSFPGLGSCCLWSAWLDVTFVLFHRLFHNRFLP